MLFSALTHKSTKAIRKNNQPSPPRTPVVARKAGMSPKPKLKLVSENIVLFISLDLNRSHELTNLFGPTPKIGSLAKVFLVISRVDETDGLTSRLLTLK
jgi:hypothetical protein